MCERMLLLHAPLSALAPAVQSAPRGGAVCPAADAARAPANWTQMHEKPVHINTHGITYALARDSGWNECLAPTPKDVCSKRKTWSHAGVDLQSAGSDGGVAETAGIIIGKAHDLFFTFLPVQYPPMLKLQLHSVLLASFFS